jgi:hypothetical protein
MDTRIALWQRGRNGGGHLNRMGEIKRARKITEWNPIGMNSKGRPKNCWRDEALNDVKKLH